MPIAHCCARTRLLGAHTVGSIFDILFVSQFYLLLPFGFGCTFVLHLSHEEFAASSPHLYDIVASRGPSAMTAAFYSTRSFIYVVSAFVLISLASEKKSKAIIIGKFSDEY